MEDIIIAINEMQKNNLNSDISNNEIFEENLDFEDNNKLDSDNKNNVINNSNNNEILSESNNSFSLTVMIIQ